MVKPMRRLLAVQLVLRLFRQGHGPVYLLDQVKSAARLLRPELLDPRQLLPVPDFPFHELQRQFAGERSWDFQF